MASMRTVGLISTLHTGRYRRCQEYVRSGADVNSRLTRSFNWRKKRFATPSNMRANSTPLHLTMEFANKEVVKYLLKHNADVYVQDPLGFTPIHLAMSSSSDLSRKLFEATPDLRDSVSSVGLSHLHVDARTEDEKAMNKLLLNGEHVIVSSMRTPSKFPFSRLLRWENAIIRGSGQRIAKSLLEAGADMDAKDLDGVSALQQALRDMSSEPADYFIRVVKEGKGNIESCGMRCCTLPVVKAMSSGSRDANVNARTRDEGIRSTELSLCTCCWNRPIRVEFFRHTEIGRHGRAAREQRSRRDPRAQREYAASSDF